MDSTSFPSLAHSSRPFPLPTVAEDTLHYAIHLPSSAIEIDAAAFATLITQHVESLLTQPWLWNKDAWELKVATDSQSKLEGTMRVGDAVDDEWLVVWLLREISRKWAELIISVRDSDGEFLLIEAANELPAWVTPDNAHNRLWLHNGHLHLVPLNVRSSSSSRPRQIPDDDDAPGFDPDAWISEDDAVRAVRTGKYVVEQRMEQAVWERIAGYPEALRTHLHRTKAWLPVLIAKALRANPELIQKAVEGFYVRDPSQLRSASRMAHFPPSPAVLSSVLMTRAAYAQLQGQVFHPPRVFGPEWTVREGAELDNERRWRDLGVKIATGFEIMYREGGRKGKGGEVNDDDVRSDPAYEKYIGTLAKAGFFGTEVQGSAQWKVRETEALRGWRALKTDDTSAHRPSFAFQVDQAIQHTDAAPVLELEVSADALEDSDSWLEVSPDELDGMLLRASGKGQNEEAAEGETAKMELGTEHGQALHDLAKKVEQFVGGQGDIEGAKFADELSDEDMEDDDDDDTEDDQAGLTAEEKAARVRELIPALSTEEWGRRESQPKASNANANPTPSVLTAIQDASDPRKTMRPPIFAKEEYDGVVDESDSDEEDELPVAGSIGRKIAQMRWADTAPKIEEVDEAEEEEARRRGLTLGDDIDEAMMRNVARTNGEDGDEDEAMDLEDPDMLDEQEEFLRFAREALGISGEAWEDMLSDRRDRGAFVPGPRAPSKSTSNNKKVSFDEPPKPTRIPGEPDESLDSFDKVMEAMEAELDRQRPSQSVKKKSKSKAKVAQKLPNPNEAEGPLPNLPTEEDLDDMSEDELAAMDRELRSALKGAGLDSDDDDDDDDEGDGGVPEAKDLHGEDKREYRMMRDLLESYTSQAGQSGVVGNLFGRLGEGGKGV